METGHTTQLSPLGFVYWVPGTAGDSSLLLPFSSGAGRRVLLLLICGGASTGPATLPGRAYVPFASLKYSLG